MSERFDGFTPPQESKEGTPVTSIPENLTRDGLILVIDKLQDGKETGQAMTGKLMNGPIEVGKPIKTAMANCTEVVSITQQGETYLIKTQSGSEYRFDPSKSIETPDYLKK